MPQAEEGSVLAQYLALVTLSYAGEPALDYLTVPDGRADRLGQARSGKSERE